MNKTPLQEVKERFGDKASLVKQVEAMFSKDDLFIEKLNEDKGLDSVSNSHLLKLFEVGTQIKEKFGSREKLVEAIVEAENRTKDEGYRARLDGFPLPRLWDYYASSQKRAQNPKKRRKRKKRSRKKS